MPLVLPHPLRDRFAVACVTGTDGKTTTTTLIDAMVRASGRSCLRITTLGAFIDDERIPEAKGDGFTRALELALDRGVGTIALEVTSHALSDGFGPRFPPDVAVLTSFARDHLDHHKSAEHYLASKAQLFLALRAGGTAVLPLELPASELILDLLGDQRELRVRRTSVRGADAWLTATSVRLSRTGLEVELAGESMAARLGRVTLPMRSEVHAQNLLGAMTAAEALGIEPEAMRAGLGAFVGPPGRMEVVWERPLVIVDFAHTPNALMGTLRAAQTLAAESRGSIRLVFGCGGERDAGKRPEMGRIASALAHHVTLTTDNPRSEDPSAIARAVASGARGPADWSEQPNRTLAIEEAIAAADENDVVIVAGKGHETTQHIGSARVPLSDLDVARTACQRLQPHAAHRP